MFRRATARAQIEDWAGVAADVAVLLAAAESPGGAPFSAAEGKTLAGLAAQW